MRPATFVIVLTLFAFSACARPVENASADSVMAAVPAGAKGTPAFHRSRKSVQIGDGSDITATDFPAFQFVAALGTFTVPDELDVMCGGSLIAEDWILTAAHCARNKWVVLGNRDLKGPDGETLKVKNKFCYKPSNLNAFENDIALLEVDRKGSSITPVLPVTGNSWETRLIMLAGWGDGALSDNLQKLPGVRVYPDAQCRASFPEHINNKTFCTIHPSGEALHRDSGGPVLTFDQSGQPVLVGIMISVANSTTPQGRPNLHVRITEYLPWIQRVMNRTATSAEFDGC